MRLEYVCPSLNRPVEVRRLRDSADAPLRVSEETTPRALPTIYQELIQASTADIVVIVADHLELLPGCAVSIDEAFRREFPEFDGVIGLHIDNLPPLEGVREYCFLALGRNFVQRFPNSQCYCPDYYHFYADTELGMCAKQLNRFHYERAAKVFTHHPNARNAKRDETYVASRIEKKSDDAVWEARRRLGYVWGCDFNRVHL